MDTFTYQDFVNFFFERHEFEDGKQWFFQPNFEDPTFDFSSPQSDKAQMVSYFKIAFNEIEALSKKFSERQFYCGIQYIIDNSVSPYSHYFLSDEVPFLERIDSVSLMYNVFEKVFATICF